MSAPISTATLQRLPALDVVRVVGALAVVGHHVGFATGVNTGGGVWGGWLARLDSGVAVFFVLSGFLLFRPWAQAQTTGGRKPTTGRYLWRRVMRVLPAYWVAVVVCLLLLDRNSDATRADWIRHFTLTQIYQGAELRHGLSQTWSLCTEVVFYLLLPIIGALLTAGRKRTGRPWAIIAGGIVITAVWVALIGAGVLSPSLHTMWLPAYGLWFGAGMLLASVHVSLRNGLRPRWRFLDGIAAAPLACWAAALAVYAIATTPIAGPPGLGEPTAAEFGTKMILYTLLAVLITIPLAFGPQTRSKELFSSPSARWLGTVSYGIFLWHPFVLEMFYQVTGRPEFTGGFWETYLVVAGGGTVLAALSFYMIERPAQRFSHRWPRPRRRITESQSKTAAATAVS
ncbi:peptidoglycan/LPS O-acetylase OafA/YrhL [Actinoplanes lutulentus]|uniref:Peptidoglycan/LPS O-acetylase OafA/YrhL n=1 Tax=Actinoplanes lutulentus TaxID=1287878 RepID=A0A327ZM12_9ACTN|nr:acyltransferase [Actinoplanes lutulentus]MBB2941186.1 peptidoglycan/LPS O-acetylase OafA/YrhL [Actinoplanes lutulentus]RAK43495.1 peptidoglycan/LPS O-acetylase OafA/YrhL [Actinoplanes lutulentus]